MSCCGNSANFNGTMRRWPTGKTNSMVASTGKVNMYSQPSRVRENYVPCCRPQSFVQINQTWAPQKPFTL